MLVATQHQVELGLSGQQIAIGLHGLMSYPNDEIRILGGQGLNDPTGCGVRIRAPDIAGIRPLQGEPE
jgi:hypothetical protein